MIHDLLSQGTPPVPQFRGNLDGWAMELAQWLYGVIASHQADLDCAYLVQVLTQQVGDPPKPEPRKGIIWLSDGSGMGAAGDVMIAVNDGTDTKYGILFDFSGGSAWPS